MTTTIDKISNEQLKLIRNMVVNQLYEMNEDKLRIASASKQSLTKVVTHLFQEIAYATGYKISLPFVYTSKVIESIWNDISEGFSSAFRNISK